MIIQEKVNEKYVRVYSNDANKKIHIIGTNVDKPMILLDANYTYEFEEWDIDERYDIDILADASEWLEITEAEKEAIEKALEEREVGQNGL